jgi:protein-tyrosine phosphatase
MIRVLFVCTANICRSPMAEGIFKKLVAESGLGGMVEADSAGTSAMRLNEPPDPRTQRTALRYGIDVSALRSRELRRTDYEQFDYLLAMDRTNYNYLRSLCPKGMEGKIYMTLEFAPFDDLSEVPDPYTAGEEGFDIVFQVLQVATRGLLAHIRKTNLLPA